MCWPDAKTRTSPVPRVRVLLWDADLSEEDSAGHATTGGCPILACPYFGQDGSGQSKRAASNVSMRTARIAKTTHSNQTS